MFDCIAGYHLNQWTCGIAKFNAILGRHLGLPVIGISPADLERYQQPLLSLKMSEFSSQDALALDAWIGRHPGGFELFLHAFDDTALEKRMLAAAARVCCGNRELYEQLKPARPDIVEAFCPGTLLNPQRFQQTELSVLHSAWRTRFACRSTPAARSARRDGKTCSVAVSTALQNTSATTRSSVRRLQSIFRQVYFKGTVGHRGVQSPGGLHVPRGVLRKGLRANNTTVNAAIGCAVITNLDE